MSVIVIETGDLTARDAIARMLRHRGYNSIGFDNESDLLEVNTSDRTYQPVSTPRSSDEVVQLPEWMTMIIHPEGAPFTVNRSRYALLFRWPYTISIFHASRTKTERMARLCNDALTAIAENKPKLLGKVFGSRVYVSENSNTIIPSGLGVRIGCQFITENEVRSLRDKCLREIAKNKVETH